MFYDEAKINVRSGDGGDGINGGTGVRTCFAWCKSGVKFAEGGRQTNIDLLPTRRHAKQIRGVYRCGAVRTENNRVVRVYADEVL